MRFSVGQELDGVEFVRILRPSKNSVAYIVRDVISQRLEHLKLVPDSLLQDEQTLKRFMREAKLHAGLSHPNIAQFYSVRRIDGELVMTREWVEGESLASKLEHGPLPVLQAIDYISQALLALDYAHGRGVIHRDLNPEKLLVTESGIVKLTGFDLARSPADPRLTGTGVVLGSAHYMPPEQVKGLSDADERSDIYSCGIVLFELVTGRRPFERRNDFEVMVAQVESPPPSPSEWNKSVSAELSNVILRALAKDPAERYQSAREFRDALRAEAEHQDLLPAPLEQWEETPIDRWAETRSEPWAPAALEVPAREPLKPLPDPSYTEAATEFSPPSSDLSRMLGLALAGFSVGLLLFLAGLILLNR